MRDCSGGYARTTVQQNLVLRWVRDESLYEVWRALGELGLAGVGPRTINDIVSCPGTDSCKLGITSSMGLNAAIQERIESMAIEDPLTRADPHQDERLPERLRPAPHRQHRLHRRLDQGRRAHRAGLHPADRRATSRAAPSRWAQRLKSRLPAKRVPEAVERWLAPLPARTRSRARSSTRSSRAPAPPRFEELVADLSLPPEFSLETMNQFIDWNRNEPFEVIRGEGECAV